MSMAGVMTLMKVCILGREGNSSLGACDDRVLYGPASGGKGSKGRNWLDCIRDKGTA